MKTLKTFAAVSAILLGLYSVGCCLAYLNRQYSFSMNNQSVLLGYYLHIILGFAAAVFFLGIYLCSAKNQKGYSILLLIFQGLLFIGVTVGSIYCASNTIIGDIYYYRFGFLEIIFYVLSFLTVGCNIFYVICCLLHLPKYNPQVLLPSVKSRRYKLTSAVLTIVVGAFLAVEALLLMGSTINAEWDLEDIQNYDFSYKTMLGTIRTVAFFILEFCVLIIVFGSKFCKNKSQKGLAITLIVIFGGFLLLFFIGYTGILTTGDIKVEVNSSLIDAAVIAAMGLIIIFNSIYLYYLKKYGVTAAVNQTDLNLNPNLIQNVAVSNQPYNTGNINRKVEILKQLKKDGIITSDELKSAVMKELDIHQD